MQETCQFAYQPIKKGIQAGESTKGRFNPLSEGYEQENE